MSRMAEFFNFMQEHNIDLGAASIACSCSDRLIRYKSVWEEEEQEYKDVLIIEDRESFSIYVTFTYDKQPTENITAIKRAFGPLKGSGSAPWVRLTGMREVEHLGIKPGRTDEEPPVAAEPTEVTITLTDAFECKYTCEAKPRLDSITVGDLTDGNMQSVMTEDQILEAGKSGS